MKVGDVYQVGENAIIILHKKVANMDNVNIIIGQVIQTKDIVVFDPSKQECALIGAWDFNYKEVLPLE